ncbi:MAG: hypothetical protein JST55_12865 [Bacteroidetes bacterium]|nr:hypothetical protein [Bacteroidota bacterium]
MMEINITIVGGCFPVQNNIPKEKLYHQIVKKELKEKYNVDLKINIIRYERFAMCFEKISDHCSKNPVDALLFHIRTEQYLRISKLFYSYCDSHGKLRRELNLPIFDRIPPEVHEKLLANMPKPSDYKERQKFLNKLKIHLNYLGGSIIGNKSYALKQYEDLFNKIVDFCKLENIKLIVAGPASRPHLNIENKLTEELGSYFEKKSEKRNTPFLNLSGVKNTKGDNLFFENGIHVSEAGHKRAAGLLSQKLLELFPILLLSSLVQDQLIYT